jgi:putative FmdB family regulatory protein
MPLYEYYCEKCDKVFEALRLLRESDATNPCPECGHDAERIMPTSFSAMSWAKGYPQRVPFHQKPVRNVKPKKSTVAPVKAKSKPAYRTGRRGAKAAKR